MKFNLKKISSILLVTSLAISFASCSKDTVNKGEIEKTTTNEAVSYTEVDKTINDTVTSVVEDTAIAEKELFSTRIEDGKLFISKYNGNQETVTIPNMIEGQEVYGVLSSAFSSNKAVKKVIFSDGIVTLGASCFYYCENLKEVELSDTLKTIGSNAFFKCTALETIVLPASVEELGMGVFQGCSKLEKVTFEGAPTYYDSNVFQGTAIETITIPEGVENLYSDTFGNCKNLKTVYLPASVTYINEYTFYKSPNVTIIAPTGSYAETFAQEEGIPFRVQ